MEEISKTVIKYVNYIYDNDFVDYLFCLCESSASEQAIAAAKEPFLKYIHYIEENADKENTVNDPIHVENQIIQNLFKFFSRCCTLTSRALEEKFEEEMYMYHYNNPLILECAKEYTHPNTIDQNESEEDYQKRVSKLYNECANENYGLSDPSNDHNVSGEDNQAKLLEFDDSHEIMTMKFEIDKSYYVKDEDEYYLEFKCLGCDGKKVLFQLVKIEANAKLEKCPILFSILRDYFQNLYGSLMEIRVDQGRQIACSNEKDCLRIDSNNLVESVIKPNEMSEFDDAPF